MPTRPAIFVAAALALCAATASAQVEQELDARKKLFPEAVGARAIKTGPDGHYFVLTSHAILVFDSKGAKIAQIPPPEPPDLAKKSAPLIVFAEDFAVDATGRTYVADRGSNTLKYFSSKGVLEKSTPVQSPTGVVVFSTGEIAVASTMQDSLITLFDQDGKILHQFGEHADLVERPALNDFLNSGRLAGDGHDNLYYVFTYFPEPTVRRYDRNGFATLEASLTGLEFMPAAQFTRKQIAHQQESGGEPNVKPAVTGCGVDPLSGDTWLAIGDNLVVVNKDGDRTAEYRTYTPEGARLEPRSILFEPDRMILLSDTLGIFEFDRPDKPHPPVKSAISHESLLISH
jgi:DNA-binding beta-propeller fold protein YncE